MTYLATFYSHFGAIRYDKPSEAQKMPARLMPVPRDLSSSCGTCVRYEGPALCLDSCNLEEVEQIVEITNEGYRTLYRAKDG